MKSVLSILLGLTGAIAIITGAQAADTTSANEKALPSSSEPSQIEQLMTQPISVRRPDEAWMSASQSAYNANTLSTISQSIKSNSTPAEGVPDFIHTPDIGANSDTNPIGFFQVPPPSPSVGINIKQ